MVESKIKQKVDLDLKQLSSTSVAESSSLREPGIHVDSQFSALTVGGGPPLTVEPAPRLRRVFNFIDTDMDGYIPQVAVISVISKLKACCQGTGETWGIDLSRRLAMRSTGNLP